MNCAKEARKLADYVSSLSELQQVLEPAKCFSYYHIGALFTDIVLQAGLNYNTVVKPRVQKILTKYPYDNTIKKFEIVINEQGIGNVINWKHPEKLNRIGNIIEFAKANNVDSCADLKYFLLRDNSRKDFLALRGVGPKTLDYLLKLLNVDTVAVDRHIYSFVKMAEIDTKGYQQTKKIVEYAADFLNISRTAIDQLIWKYMSQRKYNITQSKNQYLLEFPDYL